METEDDKVNVRRLQFMARYYQRRLMVLLGLCPECQNKLNEKPNGRKWCPECGRSNL